MIPADRLHSGKLAIAAGRSQQFFQCPAVIFRERKGRAEHLLASEFPVGEDFQAIGIADAKQNAANLNAPVH